MSDVISLQQITAHHAELFFVPAGWQRVGPQRRSEQGLHRAVPQSEQVCAAVLFVCVFCVSCVTVVVVCRTMLEAFVTDELRAADRTFSRSKIT